MELDFFGIYFNVLIIMIMYPIVRLALVLNTYWHIKF